MPMVGSRLKCERCREDMNRVQAMATVGRIRLMTGPNGERLCQKHHHEAWEEYMDNE